MTTRARRAAAWLAVAGGLGLALATQVATPAGVPLYDGVVVQEPYRFLHPAAGQVGSPTTFEAMPAVRNGVSPVLAAATTENPPQAQMIAQPGAFELTPGATSLIVSVAPVDPPPVAAPGRIAGNVYRFLVADQAGTPLDVAACDGCLTLILRVPENTDAAVLMRFADGGWTTVDAVHNSILSGYQALPTALGDYAIVETPTDTGIDPVYLIGGALLVVLLAVGALLIFRVPSRSDPPGPADGRRPGRSGSPVPPKGGKGSRSSTKRSRPRRTPPPPPSRRNAP